MNCEWHPKFTSLFGSLVLWSVVSCSDYRFIGWLVGWLVGSSFIVLEPFWLVRFRFGQSTEYPNLLSQRSVPFCRTRQETKRVIVIEKS